MTSFNMTASTPREVIGTQYEGTWFEGYLPGLRDLPALPLYRKLEPQEESP